MKNLLTDHLLQALVSPALGKPCCRKEVGYRKSLSLGFGERVPHQNPKSRDNYYGEWELGTYNGAWRVTLAGKILCASHDPVDSVEELNYAFNRIELGHLVSLQQLTDLDVRIVFDLGITVDFLAATSDEDESFHIFCPDDKYIEFAFRNGWTIGESNVPWRKS